MKHYTILIVDDTPSARAILEGALHKEDYNLLMAENGFQALDILAQHDVDVILLDVMMPGMDGFEVCQRIRATPRLAEIPVMMITALDDRNSKMRGIEVGADDFINKPFDHLELRTRLRTITKLNRYRRLTTERARLNWVLEQVKEGYLLINQAEQILYANAQARLYLHLPPSPAPLPPTLTFRQHLEPLYQCHPEDSWANWPTPNVTYYLVRAETLTTQDMWLQVDLFAQSLQGQNEYVIRLQDVTADIASYRIMWAFHEQISHKIRTPLSHVIMSINLLAAEYRAITVDDLDYFVKTAQQGAVRLERSVDEVFEYLDIISTERPIPQGYGLNTLSNMLEELKTDLQLQNVYLTFETEDLTQAEIKFNEHKLRLVLWKLLENAKKFHPENTPEVHISVASREAGIQLQIQDNGTHIPPEMLGKVWQPYYQGDKYFTGEMEGMGLGLAVVASLIWAVNGQCRIANRPDQPGVIITLTLPNMSRTSGLLS